MRFGVGCGGDGLGRGGKFAAEGDELAEERECMELKLTW